LIGEKTFAGWEVRLRPSGTARFGFAAFLVLWLCFWIVGEGFAAFVLVHGLHALLTGLPLMGKEPPDTLGPLLLVGAFLLIWLAFWTWGGIAAMHELLRLLWAEDRFTVHPRGVTLTRRLGPFRSTRELPREAVRAVYVRLYQTALMAQVGQERLELSTLGTTEERTETAALIREAFTLPDRNGPLPSEALPDSWKEVPAPEGGALLVPDPKRRHGQALALSMVTAGGWIVAGSLARDAFRNPSLGALAAMSLAAVFWLTWKTVWLWRGRKEWRMEAGRLVQQRRFDGRVTVLGEGRRLELTDSTDSDGDHWYDLAAVSDSGTRRSLLHTIHDPTDPRLLGEWLARRAGIPLDDRIPTVADRVREIDAARDTLAATGKFGRWLSRLLPGKSQR
jgi:hypothetical protein